MSELPFHSLSSGQVAVEVCERYLSPSELEGLKYCWSRTPDDLLDLIRSYDGYFRTKNDAVIRQVLWETTLIREHDYVPPQTDIRFGHAIRMLFQGMRVISGSTTLETE